MSEISSNEPTSTPQPSDSHPLARYRAEFREAFSFLKTLAIFLAIAFFLRASVVEAFKIPSGSMKPTLKIRDHILVTKFNYGLRLPLLGEAVWNYAKPKRGDIVVFKRPDDPATVDDDESKDNIIKRVIALPGERVEVRNRRVYINGQFYPEPYARWALGGIPEGNFGPERVPEGHLFLLGDNRDHSKDSRFWRTHFLPIERVKGKALIVYWSWDRLARIGTLIH